MFDYVAKVYFKCFIGIYVVSVAYHCWKSILECCTCCNGYTHMFQVYVPNVLSIFRCTLQVFYLDVAKVDLDVAYTCMLLAYVSSVLGVSYVCL
jgi:hypothetical protein